MNSGIIIVYDRPGCGPICVDNTIAQLQRVSDDRALVVKRYSECSDPFNSREVKLFTIPGGNAALMQKDVLFSETVEKVQKIVQIDGVSYLGICAGAIEASKDYSISQFKMYEGGVLSKESIPYTPMLNLYSGSSVLVPQQSDRVGLCTSQEVISKYTFSAKLVELTGCYFPNPEQIPDTEVILEYTQDCQREYSFYADFSYLHKGNNSACAIKHKSQNGTIVLSGAHPELGERAIMKISESFGTNEKKKNAFQTVASEIAPYDKERDEIMGLFLRELSIPTKQN